MKRKHLVVAIAAGVVVVLLLRRKAAAAAAAAPAGFGAVGNTPLGLASIYFDPGQTFDINANVNSPTFGNTLN